MEKKIPFTIKEDIYDKFCLALNLSKEDEEQAVETCLKWYKFQGVRNTKKSIKKIKKV